MRDSETLLSNAAYKIFKATVSKKEDWVSVARDRSQRDLKARTEYFMNYIRH